MTKLDDLRDFIRNKNKPKDDAGNENGSRMKKEEFSLEVGGASDNPMASFGDEETDPDLIDQLYSSPKSRVLRGEGAVWEE